MGSPGSGRESKGDKAPAAAAQPSREVAVQREGETARSCGSGGDAEADAGAGTPRDDVLARHLPLKADAASKAALQAPRGGEAHDEDFFSGSQSLGDAFQAKRALAEKLTQRHRSDKKAALGAPLRAAPRPGRDPASRRAPSASAELAGHGNGPDEDRASRRRGSKPPDSSKQASESRSPSPSELS